MVLERTWKKLALGMTKSPRKCGRRNGINVILLNKFTNWNCKCVSWLEFVEVNDNLEHQHNANPHLIFVDLASLSNVLIQIKGSESG